MGGNPGCFRLSGQREIESSFIPAKETYFSDCLSIQAFLCCPHLHWVPPGLTSPFPIPRVLLAVPVPVWKLVGTDTYSWVQKLSLFATVYIGLLLFPVFEYHRIAPKR